MTIRLIEDIRDDMVGLIADAVDAGSGPGTVEIRTGSQPATADDTATGTLLATFTLADPAFGAPADGVITLDVSTAPTASAVASGTAGWARVLDSDGTTVMDGSVGESAADFIISSAAVTTTQELTLVSGTITYPAA